MASAASVRRKEGEGGDGCALWAAPTASTTVTSQPWNCSTPAAVSPAMPAPITTTRRLRKGSGVPTALASVVLGAVEEEVFVLAEAVTDAITRKGGLKMKMAAQLPGGTLPWGMAPQRYGCSALSLQHQ